MPGSRNNILYFSVFLLRRPQRDGSWNKPITQFEIAGSDKVFRPATATIRNGTIILSSPMVVAPVAVRYAFKDFLSGELFSTEGYPVSSFRTDDW